MKKVIAIVGPTASGKTSLSIRIAKELGSEIVCCDSMQLYRKMDIGTAKPTKDEQAEIRHHMFDVIDPGDDYSCADYARDASLCIDDIISRGKLPIICGGSGLYLDTLLNGISAVPDIPADIRTELEALPPDELYSELLRVDPASAAATHPNNVKRVIRALEIYRGTGITKTDWDAAQRRSEPSYDSVIIGLNYRDRQILYDRINLRVDMMLDAGLLREVRELDLKRDSNAAMAIGYKELYDYIDGRCSYEDSVENLKRGTRNYAKRQLTWFLRNESIHWLYLDDHSYERGAITDDSFKNIVNNALELIKNG